MKRSIMFAVAVSLVAFVGCQKTTVQGTAGEKLTLIKPMDVTIQQGETDKVTVRVRRENIGDAIAIKLDQLPAGVAVIDEEKDKKMTSDSMTLTLKAQADAKPVENHKVNVTAEGPGDLKATQSFQITIREKK